MDTSKSLEAGKELSVSQRGSHYLRSAPNIAGSVLALGGLGLLFGGVIHAYWWAIVAGLYGAGALGWPRGEHAQAAKRVQVSTEVLAQEVRNIVQTVRTGLPEDSLQTLYSIQATLHELLPHLMELEGRGVITSKDSFTVLETVRRYLPDTLKAYLRLPRYYAHTQRLADGRTASQTLLEQLRVLDSSLRDIAQNAFNGDGELFIRNGRFLEARFSEKTAFKQ